MSEENKMPNVLKNKVDFKHVNCAVLYEFIEKARSDREDMSNYEVVFYTTIGTVKGVWLPLTENDPQRLKGMEDFYQSISEIANARLIKREEGSDVDLNLTNNTGVIPLVNVKIQPYTNSPAHNLDYFQLFTDQIVGITMGESSIRE